MLLFFFILALNYKPNKPVNIEYEFNEEKIETIDYSKIRSISGKYQYEDDNYTSSFGIDVSTFQGDIDWQKVKNDGVEFVFIRIGRRGATTGYIYDDDLFEKNYLGAKAADIKVGVYFFSQAITTEEAKLEAKWIVTKLRDKEIDLPVVFDCEDVYLEDEESRILDLSKEEITNHAIAFFQELEKSGYQGMLYANLDWTHRYYDMELLKDYPFWFAQYDVTGPTVDLPINIWQYSDKGTINGINHPVDLNIMFIKKDN